MSTNALRPGPPASMRQTVTERSCDNRAARTHPAEPPPTTRKSKDSAARPMQASYHRCASEISLQSQDPFARLRHRAACVAEAVTGIELRCVVKLVGQIGDIEHQ